MTSKFQLASRRTGMKIVFSAGIFSLGGLIVVNNQKLLTEESLSRRASVIQTQHARNSSIFQSASGKAPCQAFHLVWLTWIGWEDNYVPHQLLSRVRISSTTSRKAKEYRNEPIDFNDCSLLVTRNRQGNLTDNYRIIDQGVKHSLRFAVVLLGEEEKTCTWGLKGGGALAPLLIRNYWHADCANMSNVLVVPLGVKNGQLASVAERTRPPSARPHSVVFASDHHVPGRSTLVQVFKKLKKSKIVYPGTVPNHTRLLCNAKFALTPRGNVEDTWRIQEALNCGTIPIVTDGGLYFSGYMPRAMTKEFIVVDKDISRESVVRASMQITSLLQKPEELDSRAASLSKAYAEYQNQWQNEVARRLYATT